MPFWLHCLIGIPVGLLLGWIIHICDYKDKNKRWQDPRNKYPFIRDPKGGGFIDTRNIE